MATPTPALPLAPTKEFTRVYGLVLRPHFPLPIVPSWGSIWESNASPSSTRSNKLSGVYGILAHIGGEGIKRTDKSEEEVEEELRSRARAGEHERELAKVTLKWGEREMAAVKLTH